MKLILFVIVFTCILVIRFCAFIMKSAFDTAQIIERPRNTISKRYDNDDVTLVDIINIVRNISGECYSFDENSCEELAFSIELFILLISYIIVYLCKTKVEQQKLMNIYIMAILEYITRNSNNISYTDESVFQSFLYNYYTKSILTENFISRYKKYEPYLKIYVKDSANITEQEMCTFVFKMAVISNALKDYLYDTISPEHKHDMFDVIILEEYNTLKIIYVVINIRKLSLDMIKNCGINIIKEIEQPHEGY